jgi:type VI secretion system protein ImpG
MDPELVEFYKHELALLYEHAAAFSEEYPGIADRLGGLTRERGDPMVAGLLEGTALLAARVQLKLKSEYAQFTGNLLDQLLPNYLAPTPSAMLAQFHPTYGDPNLRAGRAISRGSLLDARYPYKDRDISCTFSLCESVTLWPLSLTRAEYFSSLTPLQALGLNLGPETSAGLRLTLQLRMAATREEEPSETEIVDDPTARLAGIGLDMFPVYLLGAEADAVALYEQLFAHLNGIYLRYLDSFGDPQTVMMDTSQLEQVGFGPEDRLLPYEARLFRGFELLQEYMTFPRKFLGFRMTGLRSALARIPARVVDIIFTFDQSDTRLAAAVQPEMFALYAAPAINLFRKSMDRISIKPNQHEYLVVPDRTQYLAYEVHRITDVFLHHAGQEAKERVYPMFRSTLDRVGEQRGLYYSSRRLPRRRTGTERRLDAHVRYAGTDIYLSVSPPGGGMARERKPELSVLALCSNRHMPEFLTSSRGTTEFRLRENTALEVTAAIAPAPPRDPPLVWDHENPRQETAGQMAWRMINLLSLNHLGLGESDGRALRETLSLFGDLSDPVIARRIRAVRGVSLRDVTRRLPQRTGVGVARGIEARVTLEEKGFEGSGTFLLGAVLERFFAEYVGLNHFVQTVIVASERGVLSRWPPRSGSRGAL